MSYFNVLQTIDSTPYRIHFIYVVCGINHKDMIEMAIPIHGDCSLDFLTVHASVKDSFITNLTEFHYGSKNINGCILDKRGFKQHDNDGIVLQICNKCLSALNQKCVPHLSLTNYFFRGTLPDEFADLTWVEEMVCAKYRNTTHINQIYGSLDVSQPKIFHGNTCTHEMNVLSTMSMLSQTISDVNDMLTIIFVGTGKFDPNCLCQMFTIQKKKKKSLGFFAMVNYT